MSNKPIFNTQFPIKNQKTNTCRDRKITIAYGTAKSLRNQSNIANRPNMNTNLSNNELKNKCWLLLCIAYWLLPIPYSPSLLIGFDLFVDAELCTATNYGHARPVGHLPKLADHLLSLGKNTTNGITMYISNTILCCIPLLTNLLYWVGFGPILRCRTQL